MERAVADDGKTAEFISQNARPALKSDKVALVARGKVRQRSVGVDNWKSDGHVLG